MPITEAAHEDARSEGFQSAKANYYAGSRGKSRMGSDPMNPRL